MDLAKLARDYKRRSLRWVVVGDENYGEGSSREHAALCPMYLGVKAVVATSFERIHTANLVNFGIMPLIFTNPDDYESIKVGDELTVGDWRTAVEKGENVKLKDMTEGIEIECTYSLSERQRKIVLAGGLLNCTNH